jgi:integrase
MRAIFKRKLTPLDATRLRPRSKVFMIWDTQERGLALQVQPSGHRSYKFIYSFKRKSRWLTIGPADTVSLSLARESALKLRLAVHQGEDPGSKVQKVSRLTFAVIAGRYVAEHAMKRNKSWRQASSLITRYVLPSWADRDASTLTRADVRALLGTIGAPILANQVLASTSAVFTWAIRQEILTNNPCRGVDRHETTSRERVLSDAEVPLFWSSFSGGHVNYSLHVNSGPALQVLLLTGQRPGEVAHMRHEHIEGEWWTLPGQPEPATRWPGTKNGQTHRVFLPSRVQQIIAELGVANATSAVANATTGFVFGSPPALDVAMRGICKALSVPRATPHDLRRTHGTTITGLGFGRPAMNRIQNHAEGGISSVYDRHEYAEENKRVMEAVAARIIALAEGVDPASNVIALR